MQRTEILCSCDPGHGGANRGAVSAGNIAREELMTLDVGLAVRELDSRIILTRDSDVTIDYAVRAARLKQLGVSFVVCIHYDSWPRDPLVHGLRAYYHWRNPVTSELAKFALLNAPEPLRGGKIIADRDSTAGVRRLCTVYPMDVLLLELGFLSNVHDLKFLIRQDGIDACARLVVACCERYKVIKGTNHGRQATGDRRES